MDELTLFDPDGEADARTARTPRDEQPLDTTAIGAADIEPPLVTARLARALLKIIFVAGDDAGLCHGSALRS